jgi:hypothetical protein
MRGAGLTVERAWVKETPPDDESVFRVTRELLGERPRPTAIVVWSPTAAVPALAAARQSGLRLPEELSVVSYNDSPIAVYLDPPLTTVRMPLGEMAERSVECLLRTIAGERASSVVVRTPPALVERGRRRRRRERSRASARDGGVGGHRRATALSPARATSRSRRSGEAGGSPAARAGRTCLLPLTSWTAARRRLIRALDALGDLEVLVCNAGIDVLRPTYLPDYATASGTDARHPPDRTLRDSPRRRRTSSPAAVRS